MSEKIIYINADQWEEKVLKGKNVIVDFYSSECPPCEALASKFEGLSEIYSADVTFIKIFRQENRGLAEALDVTGSPTVLFYQDGKEVGDKLSGGIKRSDLTANLNALVGEKKAAELGKKITPVSTECEVLILGGGPSGLTAGIYTAQAKLNTIVVDTALPGGQVTTTHLVSNYPGFEKPVEGFMLMHYMNEQAKNAGVNFRSAVDVTSVNLETKEILIDGFETIKAEKIILATGASYRELGVPGEKEFKGKGISYCATCDAKYFDNKHVIVIGGGNSAIEESLFITKFADRVTIIHQFDTLQANKIAQEKAFANDKIEFIFEHEPRAFIRNEDGTMTVEVEDLKSGSRKEMNADGIFIFAGMKPNTEQFDGKLKYDEWGYVEVDNEMHTSIPDVFAAGDLRGKMYRQITTAVADGTIAAISASKDLEN